MKSPLLTLHLVALIWGSSGIWGELVTLSAEQTVAARTVVAALALGVIVLLQGRLFERTNWSHAPSIVVSALFLGIHWYCFFYTLQHGSIALAMVTFATTPVFITLIEPLVSHKRYEALPFLCAVLALFGVWCVHPMTSLSALDKVLAVAVGILSGIALAICSLITRYRLAAVHPTFLCFSVNSCIALGFLSFTTFSLQDYSSSNVIGILGLGILCSALGQMLFVRAMKKVSAGSATIIASLEAPYGIILAALFAHQPLTLGSVLGALLVCASALLITAREAGKI
jgi:drug/metabolite transporter (DMT)-like permease